jgi:hypothetical protein
MTTHPFSESTDVFIASTCGLSFPDSSIYQMAENVYYYGIRGVNVDRKNNQISQNEWYPLIGKA